MFSIVTISAREGPRISKRLVLTRMATLDAWDDEDEWQAGVDEIAEKLRISEATSEATAASEPSPPKKSASLNDAASAAPVVKPAKVSNVKVIEKPKLPPAAPVAPPTILARAPEDGGSAAAAHRKQKLRIRSTEEDIDSAILSSLESHRNRMQLLEIEEAICKFAQSEQNEAAFPPVHNSYWRLIHFRIADRFRLGHTIQDETGELIFYKTEEFSLPRTLLMDMDLDGLYKYYCNQEAMRDGIGGRSGSGNSIDNYGEEGGAGGAGGGRDGTSSGGGKKVMMLRRSPGNNGNGGGKGGRDDGPGGKGGNGKGGKGGAGKKGGDPDGDKEKAYAEARARIFAASSGGGASGGGGGPPSVFGGRPPR